MTLNIALLLLLLLLLPLLLQQRLRQRLRLRLRLLLQLLLLLRLHLSAFMVLLIWPYVVFSAYILNQHFPPATVSGLMFAGDFVGISETPEGLQKQIGKTLQL